jgi:hypothetical protein
MLVLSFSLVAVQAEETTQGKENPAVETGGDGEEKAAEVVEEGKEKAAELGKEEAKAGEHSEEKPAEKSGH